MFTEKERAYLKNNLVARLGTMGCAIALDGTPVDYEFDGQCFYVDDPQIDEVRPYENKPPEYVKIALVIVDFILTEKGMPGIRGMRIYGTTERVTYEHGYSIAPYLKMTPTTTWSWGIESPAFSEYSFTTHKTSWITESFTEE